MPGAVAAVDHRQSAAAHRGRALAFAGDAARALALHRAPAQDERDAPSRISTITMLRSENSPLP